MHLYVQDCVLLRLVVMLLPYDLKVSYVVSEGCVVVRAIAWVGMTWRVINAFCLAKGSGLSWAIHRVQWHGERKGTNHVHANALKK